MSEFEDFLSQHTSRKMQQQAESNQKLEAVEYILGRYVDDLKSSSSLFSNGATFNGAPDGSSMLTFKSKVFALQPTSEGIKVAGKLVSVRGRSPQEFQRVAKELNTILVEFFEM